MSDNPEVAQPTPEPTPTPAPEPAPATPAEAAPAPAAEPAPVAAATTVAKKKSKVPIIIASSVVAAGCIAGVGFALANTVFKPKNDAVSEAISKILSGNRPNNIAINGNISITGTNDYFKSGTITLDTKMASDTNVSDTTMSLKATLGDNSQINIGLGTKSLANGDIYVKLTGLDESTIDKIMRNSTLTGGETNCIDDETGMTNCGYGSEYDDSEILGGSLFYGLGDSLTMLNDLWIKIPGEILSQTSSETSSFALDPSSQCLLSAMNNMSDYGKAVSDLYNDHKFVTSSTDNITVAKKNNDIYKISIDNDKLAEFINAASNTQVASDIKACAGDSIKVAGNVTSAQIAEFTKELPATYVEIDGSYNITRLYIDGGTDLSISYPASVDVTAPTDYQDITTLIMTLFMGGFDFDYDLDYDGDYDDYDFDFDFDSDDFDYDSLLQMLQ